MRPVQIDNEQVVKISRVADEFDRLLGAMRRSLSSDELINLVEMVKDAVIEALAEEDKNA